MFEISTQTKAEAIEAIKAVLAKDGVHDKHLTDAVLGEAFEEAVRIVKSQFGF
jgi:hypothetical protein